MLVLQRHVGERIVVEGGIEITVISVTRSGVRLAVKAPRGTAVLRGEVHDIVLAANVHATRMSDVELEGDTPPQGEVPR